MSWLKKVTGVQELINEQKNCNALLSKVLTELVQHMKTLEDKQSKMPRFKGD